MKDGKPAVLFSVLLVLTSRTKEDLYGYRFFTMYGYRHGIDVDECALATGQAWDPSTDLVADDGGCGGRRCALSSGHELTDSHESSKCVIWGPSAWDIPCICKRSWELAPYHANWTDCKYTKETKSHALDLVSLLVSHVEDEDRCSWQIAWSFNIMTIISSWSIKTSVLF